MSELMSYFQERTVLLFTLGKIVFVAAALAIEFIWAKYRGHAYFDGRDTRVNFIMYGGYLVIRFSVISALTFWLFWEVRALTPFRLGGQWWHWAVLLVADDFLYYWYHRVCHHSRIFWATHEGHHSSRHFNLTTGLRQPWTPIFEMFFLAPLILIGFPPGMVVIVHGLNLGFQILLHTRTIGTLGPLESVFNTPSNHRVHHACQEQYLDRNLGGVFMIWDKMFGTYAREVEAPRYGLSHTERVGVWENSFGEWTSLIQDLRRAPSLGAAVKLAFRAKS